MRRWLVSLAILAMAPAQAADVVKPAEVTGLTASRVTPDVHLGWTAVAVDVTGSPETVTQYRIYRGLTADFVPDRAGGSNRIGTSATTSFVDAGAAGTADTYHYLVSAVDAAGNESASEPAKVTTPPTLSGSWTETTIELSWSGAAPADQVSKYLVYYGTAPSRYDFVKDVGAATSTSMTGLATNTNYYYAVVAVDLAGNESDFSNEHVDVVAGRIAFKAHDQDYLCWGAAKCPADPGEVQRSDGWQLMVPVDFPEGDWGRVLLKFTMDSRLCTEGQNGCTNRCGEDAAQGGWNPCGDPWDRIATVFLVLDEACIANGTSCANRDNLELIHAITPFGTDAPPPAGRGIVPPRVVTFDITPYVPLLAGRRYVGAEIGHFTQAGWHVTTEFQFSKRPDEVSPEPPADGIRLIGWGDTPFPTRSVTVPATATQVKMRLFTTGHGGNPRCDGGSNNGGACTSNANCPGGSCQNCDEFCHRTNRILKNGAPVWTVVPWNSCGFPFDTSCWGWNSCGQGSCPFNRAGWCPGNISCHTSGACDQDLDMTAHFPPGGTYDVGYDVLVQTGSWSVSLVLYWYE